MKEYKPKQVWIVEANWTDDNRKWYPTVGIGLNREDGRQALKQWRAQNPDDQFRLVCYYGGGTKK